MGKYAYDILIMYLEDNNLTTFLKIISHYLDIKITQGGRRDEEGLTGTNIENDKVLVLNTALVTRETEESILNDEKYKYDHLESFVQQLKKQKDAPRQAFTPNASYINAEIEKLKDLCKRVTVNKSNLPSICCYTIHNTHDKLTCSEISDDSRMIALGYQDSYIEIHSLDTQLQKMKTSSELNKSDLSGAYEELGTSTRLVGHSGPVYGLKFFSNNKSLLSCSQDCTVRLWSLDLFVCVGVYKAHVFPVWCIDIANDNFYFASGSADRQVCVWSVSGGRPERLFVSALSDVSCVKFHPNKFYLFTGSADCKVRMHALCDGSLVRIFSGHTDGVTCLAVSWCGKFLLSGGRDRTVILWDINAGKAMLKFTGHEKTVYSVGFCWFGSVVASCGGDNTVRLYDRSDPKGTCLGVYQTKNTPLHCVKFGYRNIISVVGPYSVN